MTDKIHQLLNFWFGEVGVADLPTSNRTSLWFGDNTQVKEEFYHNFTNEFKAATQGELVHWKESSRGRLALILLLDQFPRFIYRGTAAAFDYDAQARMVCEEGLAFHADQEITLIERVFFYMPLVHAEDEFCQERSIRLYQDLVRLSMPETTQVYQLFLAYAYAHFRVIKEFRRFPQRNQLLSRESTVAELAFLKNT